MDISSVIPVDSTPLQPAIRLAHRNRAPDRPQRRGRCRHLLDWELVYLVSGTMWWWWAHTDGSHRQRGGECALIPPGLTHAYAIESGEHIAVHFDLHHRPGLAHPHSLVHHDDWIAVDTHGDPPWFRLGSPEVGMLLPASQPVSPARWEPALTRIVELTQAGRGSLPDRVTTSALLLRLLGDLDHSHDVAAERADPRILACLAEVPSTASPTIAGLAHRCGLSEGAFRSAFRRTTGELPHRFFERRRMAVARQMLQETELSVAEIAAACGYDDPFHFSRVCKRVTGRPPTAWRDHG